MQVPGFFVSFSARPVRAIFVSTNSTHYGDIRHYTYCEALTRKLKAVGHTGQRHLHPQEGVQGPRRRHRLQVPAWTTCTTSWKRGGEIPANFPEKR